MMPVLFASDLRLGAQGRVDAAGVVTGDELQVPASVRLGAAVVEAAVDVGQAAAGTREKVSCLVRTGCPVPMPGCRQDTESLGNSGFAG
jgi:hypothetical protein